MKKISKLLALVLVVAMLSTLTVFSASAATTVTTEQELKDAVAAGGEIVLGDKIDLSTTLTISKDVTLDLNGKTITTVDGATGINITAGNVVINDSVGTGKITSNNNNTIVTTGGSLTINGGTFNTEVEKNNDTKYAAVYNDGTAILTINGGTFTAPKAYAIYNNSTMEINGGTFSSDATYTYMATVLTSKQATTTINGGKFTNSASYGVIRCYGKVTINGGEFISSALYATVLYAYDENGTFTINGGSFIAEKGDYALYFVNGTVEINDCVAKAMVCGLGIDEATVTLNGGMYSSDFDMTLQEYTDLLPVEDKSGAESLYNYYKSISAGIANVNGTDLLGSLGSNRSYYSKSGINKITVGKDIAKSEAIVVVDNIDPTIKDGANQKITGTLKDTTISSNVDYKYFFDGTNIIGEVQVDGKTVEPKNYNHKSGSTVITFTEAFLKTLSAGEHKVAIISNVAGYKAAAETTLTIVAPTPETKEETKAAETAPAAEPEAVADTADTNAIAVFAALTALSAAGFVTVKKKEN